MDNNENKITLVLKNFIDELAKGYDMSEDDRELLEKMAQEDTTKLFYQNEDI